MYVVACAMFYCLFVSKFACVMFYFVCTFIYFIEYLFLGCDVSDLSEDANEDLEGLDATATYVASLLSAEPPGSKFSITTQKVS